MIGLNPYTIIGAIGAIITSFFFGVYQGWSYEHDKFVAYKAEVTTIADKQNAKNEFVIKQSALVNKGIKNEYEARIIAIRNHYSSGVRNTSGGPMSTISNPTFSIDGKATNLELTCAYTTQQLISLQDWVREQVALK